MKNSELIWARARARASPKLSSRPFQTWHFLHAATFRFATDAKLGAEQRRTNLARLAQAPNEPTFGAAPVSPSVCCQTLHQTLEMDGNGHQFPPSASASNPSNPTSPVDSFADGFSHDISHNHAVLTSSGGTSPRAHTHPAYPGASVYTPTDMPSERLNPRSCVTCRRRKVRCDKHMPCSNCRRAQIPCIFPAPGRAPRRPRPKDPNAPPKQPSSEREMELMKRLRKLEGIVEELSGQIEVETARNNSSSGNSPEATAHNGGDTHTPGSGNRVERADSIAAASAHSQGSPRQPSDGRPSPFNFNASSSNLLQRQDSVNKKFGRLVINDHGKTRYVSSAFWSKITDEVSAIRAHTSVSYRV